MTIASILPPGKTQFFDANGNPLAAGSVAFYIPNTTTPKNTWQDPTQLILNTNPVILDSAGEALIYGSGQYRQKVFDSLNNLIWDQLTASASYSITSFFGVVNIVTFAANGTYVPSANLIGATVEGVGGGGGSGGCTSSANNASPGGSAGNYCRSYFNATTIGASQIITIGAGGIAGSSVGPAPGGAGGDTSFGILLIAKGGFGSNPGSTAVALTPATSGSTGQIVIQGQAGAAITGSPDQGSSGGNSILGFGGTGSTGVGTNGTSFGGGAGGSSSGSGALAVNGGVGGSGYIIITEYLSS